MQCCGTLKELENGEWVYRGSKYVSFNKDRTVWAGSITSREGWSTTQVVWGYFEDDDIYFTTRTGSKYKVEAW